MSAGITFVGAGPGAEDLITVRGARLTGEADVVLWTPGIVAAGWVRENTKPDAELVDMTRRTDDEIVEVYRRAVRDKLRVVRLFPGDPATWPGLRAHLDMCSKVGLAVDVVAGVSPVSAAAVSVGVSLVEPDYADSMIFAGQETTGMPDLAQIKEYSQFGTTMAVLVPAARAAELADALRSGGYDDETPIVAAYKVSWPDEIVVRTTVGELVATVKQHRLWRHTLFLVGGAVRAGRARTNGEAPRRPESVARWSRSKSSWLEAKRTEKAAPERVTVNAVAEPDDNPVPEKKTVAPAKAAAASSAKQTVTAKAEPGSAETRPATTSAAAVPTASAAKTGAAKPTPAKTAAAAKATRSVAAKPTAKATAKKAARAQPQRGRRSS